MDLFLQVISLKTSQNSSTSVLTYLEVLEIRIYEFGCDLLKGLSLFIIFFKKIANRLEEKK